AAGYDRPQEAADTCVGVARHGLDTLALTPVAGGEAEAAVTHVEESVVRAGTPMRIAADSVQDGRRASNGRLGVDAPLFGLALSVTLGKGLREEHGAGGAGQGQRRAARAAQDGAQGPHRNEEAGSSRNPGLPMGGTRASRNDTGDMAM